VSQRSHLMRRVVVTGAGAVTPFGVGLSTLWNGLLAGRSGIRRITAWDPSHHESQIAGEVPNWDPADFIDRRAARRMDRFAQFAVAAAGEAIEHAGLRITDAIRDRVAVVVASSSGGALFFEQQTRVLADRGADRVSPFTVPMFLPNMAASQISLTYGTRGPAICGAAACASGCQAFVDAVRLIRSGEADVAITGGSDAGVTAVAVAGLGNLGALSRRNDDPATASRPFERDRDGFVIAEGAAVLILESEEHALARGAEILCEAHGGSSTSDAYHITAPDPSGDGPARAMREALERAGIAPATVDMIAAHATATPAGDIAETEAIRHVFADHVSRIAVSATKSMVGHMLAAAGAVSGLACALAIRDGEVPPTANLFHPDPACDLDYVPGESRRMQVRAAIANGFGFGGQNASALFSRYDGPEPAA